MARSIVVPPLLVPALDKLIERMTRANGGQSPEACRRVVESTVLKRGIEELGKDLADFDQSGSADSSEVA